MRITYKHRHLLFDGKELDLTSYNENKVWYWIIYTKDPSYLSKGFHRDKSGYFELWLKHGKQYPYSAYESSMYCIYNGYKYDVENIWHDMFILYPEEVETRKYLNIHSYHDNTHIEIPYDDFIASSPFVWEERSPIEDFVFDVEPFVYLYKDGAYVEENLHGAWYNKNNALK